MSVERYVVKNNDIMFGWEYAFRYTSAVATIILTTSAHVGTFQIGEVVYGSESGATGIVVEVTDTTHLLIKESTGIWDVATPEDDITGIDSGAVGSTLTDASAGTSLVKDHEPVSSDVDWVLNLESQSMLDLKPKPETVQKWYVGNGTRKYSYTYITEWKPGSGSITGDLKTYHPIDAILGCTTQASDQTTYDVITMDGEGDERKSFFLVYKHGTRYKSIIGITANGLTINMSEGNMVTFDMTVQTAKEISVTDTFTPASNLIQKDISPFHWKHVAINLKLSGGANTNQSITGDEGDSTTSSVTYNSTSYDSNFQVESCTINITNTTEYKFGAPSSGGQLYANYYKETLFEATVELVVYPTSTLLWMLSPETLGTYGKKYVGWHKLTFASGGNSYTVGEIVTQERGLAGEATGVVYSADTTTVIIYRVSGTFDLSDPIVGNSSLNSQTPTAVALKDDAAQLDFTAKLDRYPDSASSHDYIQIDLTKLELDPVSEDLSNIEAGVDPITLTLRLAESASTITALAHCPMHTNKSSYPY